MLRTLLNAASRFLTPERTHACPNDEHQRAIVQTLNAILDEYKRSEQKRDDSDQQTAQIDRKRLRVEQNAMWAVIITLPLSLLTLAYAIKSANEAHRSADAAQASARAAQLQIEATERPWVKLTDVAITSPFRQGDDRVNVFLGFSFTFKNIGRSVARNVGLRALMYPQSSTPAVFTEPLERQRALCEKPDPDGFLKSTLFPDDTDVQQSSLSLGVAEMTERSKTFPKDAPYPPVHPVLIGCITYGYESSERPHRTFFAYEVVRITEQEPSIPHLFDSRNLPPDLRLVRLMRYPNARANDAD